MGGASGEPVLYEVTGRVATITLNRPERLNALDGSVIATLLGRVEHAADDPEVRSVVLTGAGRGFCAGGDVNALASRTVAAPGVPRPAGSDNRRLFRVVELLRAMPKITVAAVNGPAAGAGLSFACACDLRVAARSAIFTTAFLTVGQAGDYGGIWTVSRLLGEARARQLFLAPDRIDATEALRIGLVGEVVDDERFAERVRAVAERAAGFAPLTVAAMKANLEDAAGEPSLASYLDREAVRFTATVTTRDAVEASRAFVEKRPPVFEGR